MFLKCTLKKVFKLILINLNFFFFSKYIKGTIKIFFKSEITILKQFCPQLFLMLSVLGSRMEHKKAIINQTAVYLCLHHEFYNNKKNYPFLIFFAALRSSLWYFYNIFQGFRCMLGKMWFLRWFWLFNKISNILI